MAEPKKERSPRANRKSIKSDFVKALRTARLQHDPATFAAIENFTLQLAKNLEKINLKAEDYAALNPATGEEVGTETED